ncbi:hypothetical protein NX801_00965 [Streptomyces sp. LP05-1]|uniref:ATP-grasp domain-containing protein n=1 Tax=Streptomyces pyxinae TaxID=2970734 RepID=A0ABT2CA27_9ACTN|nr:hypothetical protein [Streptomyces sp. LP05-1]MCS0634258.1 hypothetical protein [Streptomyces sp. LP05-1]
MTGRTVPAGVEAYTEAAILAAVSLGLEVLGLRDGIAHTNLAFTSEGSKLIQVGAGPPDGATMEMIEHATGVNVARTYLQATLGQPPDIRPARREAAAVRFISTVHHGVFHELTGLSVSPHVIAVRSCAEPGELVGDTYVTHTRLGHLIVVAATPPQADAYADRAVEGISSHVEA